jgi:sialate O-acetylesterase
MVLQRGQTIPVWGWADPGEKVAVTLALQTQTTNANDAGKWRVAFKPLDSRSTPIEMIVQGKNSRTVSDILIGDVWV